MAKKTTRTTKTGQQRTKEEQWRRRMAAQARTNTVPLPTERDASSYPVDTTAGDGYDGGTYAAALRSRSTEAAQRQNRAPSAATAASQRRAASTNRAARTRLAANTLSLDEEMHYVRSDIRRLVLLTLLCIAVLVALSFFIR